MSQDEYFVRQPETVNASGPYSVEKLISLAEAGKINQETLYYDNEQDAWAPLESHAELYAQLFPEKRKLKLKAIEEAEPQEETLASRDAGRPAVTVEQMLAAAEAESEETRHIKDSRRWESRAAAISLPLLALTMLLSAISLIYPSWKVIKPLFQGTEGGDWMSLLTEPLPLIGVIDLIFALLLFLSQTSIYPLLSLRVMVGLGYFGFSAYAVLAAGEQTGLSMMVSAALFSIGVFATTLTLRFSYVVMFVSMAIFGIVGYGILTVLPELL